MGAVWAYAQGPDLISPLWEPQSLLPKISSHPPPPATTTAEGVQKRLLGPEIWRLPPTIGASVEPIPAPAPTAFAPIANAPIALSHDKPIAIEPPPPEIDNPWDGSFDLGLDGSEGNSETFNFRFGFHANRRRDNNVLTLGLDYTKSTAETKDTSNRLFFDGRFEWLIHQSRWSWFLHETVEYDEFQSFNVRDTSDAGLGYRLIRNEITTLIGRFGSGFSHEYGGPDNGRFTPEAVFGLQLEHKISKRQKLVGMVEYAPDVGYFLRYRIRTQAAWEVLLDSERNLSLRVGVLDRYTSQPNGARPNDLDYASVLIWKF